MTKNTESLIPHIVYYSGSSGMTEKFVNKLGFPASRIPISKKEGMITVNEDFVFIVPTYGGGNEEKKNAIHRQIISFLNIEENRKKCVGIIGAGNINFGEHYVLAAKLVAAKLNLPLISTFELMGTPEEVENIKSTLEKNWEILIKRNLKSNVVTKIKD